MVSYVYRRALQSIVVLLGISAVVFVVTLLTGDPVRALLGEAATEADIQAYRAQLHLDKPLPIQYVMFLTRAVRLDFGDSLRYREPALDLVLERLPATLSLGGAALFVLLLFALPAGLLSAMKHGTLWDSLIQSVVLFMQSVPVFLSGVLLILLLGVHWQVLPTSGYGTLQHLVMPAATLGMYSAVRVARMLRASMLEVLDQHYVRTARAKGLPERAVSLKHALRNALIPVITLVGMETGMLLGASVVTETVFAWPGIGQLLVNAIYSRDFPLVQGAVLLIAFMFLIINLAVDLVYAVIDPRIRYG